MWAIAFAFGVALLMGCQAPLDAVVCDAESVVQKEGKTFFINSGYTFSGGDFRSKENARSGQWSVKLHREQEFGLGSEIEDLTAGDRFKISVWRKGNHGVLVVSADRAKIYLTQEQVAATENGWGKLEVIVTLPPHYQEEALKVYVWNPHTEATYFDDLSITRVEATPPEGSQPIALTLSEKRLNKLHGYVQRAIQEGRLSYGKDDWKKAKFQNGLEEYKAKVRLKGDWVDHLQTDKWSLRVRLKGGETWNGKRTFSIMHPQIRYYLHEWVYHQLLEKAGVLTTSYDLVPVTINGHYQGIYAWEEHFEKYLVEARQRREGPILKFYEEGLFQLIMDRRANGDRPEAPLFAASTILPFQASKVAKDPAKLNHFLMGRRLLDSYRSGARPASAIFDLQLLADFAAITDLCKAWHAVTWHNLRFYYNPVTCRLEPIGYDGFPGEHIHNEHYGPLSGLLEAHPKLQQENPHDRAYYALFTDPLFLQLYSERVAAYTDKKAIAAMMADLEPELSTLESWLQAEHPGYAFPRDYLSANAEKMRQELPQLQSAVTRGGYSNFPLSPKDTSLYAATSGRAILPGVSVKAHAFPNSSGRWTLKATNYHSEKLQLVGAGNLPDQPQQPFPPSELPACQTVASALSMQLALDTAYSWLFLKAPNDSLVKVAIRPWSDDTELSARERLDLPEFTKLPDFVEKTEGICKVPNGNHVLNRPWTVPAGQTLYFEAGASLDLQNGAFIICYSTLSMQGTEAEPVRVFSSDQSGMGLTVLEAPAAMLVHAQFDHLNSLSWNGWEQTGAVNFYSSKVTFLDTDFQNSLGEDALNLFRCEFNLQSCRFSDTRYDAFDGDFCQGKVERCVFSRIGDDGIDFSGSDVSIVNCQLNEVGDKGLSLGEATSAKIVEARVQHARTGLSVKDRSVVTAQALITEDCKVGIGVYVKKKAFGPAKLKLENWQNNTTDQEVLVDLGCEFSLDGEISVGSEALDIGTLFY